MNKKRKANHELKNNYGASRIFMDKSINSTNTNDNTSFNENSLFGNEINNSSHENKDALTVRRNYKFYANETKQLFNIYNAEPHVYKGIKMYACGKLLDQTFLLGLLKCINADFIDFTNLGARGILQQPYVENFQAVNNIKVFSTETISTSELEKTLKISTYEPFEDLGHFFSNMDDNVIEESKKSYVKRSKISDKYKKDYYSEMLRKRNNKPIIGCYNQDITERCFVLAYNFKLFEDEKNMKFLRYYSKKDAKDVLSILKKLLEIYTKEEIAEFTSVSMDIYVKAVSFFEQLSEGCSFDETNHAQKDTNHMDTQVERTEEIGDENVFNSRDINFANTQCEPVEKKKRKTLNLIVNNEPHIRKEIMGNVEVKNDNIIDQIYHDKSFENQEVSADGIKVIYLEPHQFFGEEFKTMVLNMDFKELVKCVETFSKGIILKFMKDENTLYKYKMDISISDVASLVRKILAKSKLNTTQKFLVENFFYKGQLMSTEDESMNVKGKSLRLRKAINYSVE